MFVPACFDDCKCFPIKSIFFLKKKIFRNMFSLTLEKKEKLHINLFYKSEKTKVVHFKSNYFCFVSFRFVTKWSLINSFCYQKIFFFYIYKLIKTKPKKNCLNNIYKKNFNINNQKQKITKTMFIKKYFSLKKFIGFIFEAVSRH